MYDNPPMPIQYSNREHTLLDQADTHAAGLTSAYSAAHGIEDGTPTSLSQQVEDCRKKVHASIAAKNTSDYNRIIELCRDALTLLPEIFELKDLFLAMESEKARGATQADIDAYEKSLAHKFVYWITEFDVYSYRQFPADDYKNIQELATCMTSFMTKGSEHAAKMIERAQTLPQLVEDAKEKERKREDALRV
jgi:hypothetical protein